MEKSGVSHVEIILSFVLFVGAIGFALYFFSPIRSSRLVDSSFDYLFREIEQNASSKIFIFNVKVNKSAALPFIVGFNISGSDLDYGTKIFNEGGVELNSGKEGEIVYGKTNTRWTDFVMIVLSDEFIDGEIRGEHNKSYYEISSSLKKKVLSEKKILELNKSYYEDYVGLKKEFNIPGRVNFGLELNLPDKTIKSENDVPAGLEVFVKEKRYEILRENGEIEFGEIVVKVW